MYYYCSEALLAVDIAMVDAVLLLLLICGNYGVERKTVLDFESRRS